MLPPKAPGFCLQNAPEALPQRALPLLVQDKENKPVSYSLRDFASRSGLPKAQASHLWVECRQDSWISK